MRQDGRLTVQFNHVVKNGKPCPTSFVGQQWHHVQGGDHDIDTDLAWDITTGGSAANGARIVVAVLEAGSNYNHVDLIGNHWVNDAEILATASTTTMVSCGTQPTTLTTFLREATARLSGDWSHWRQRCRWRGVNWDVEIMQVKWAVSRVQRHCCGSTRTK